MYKLKKFFAAILAVSMVTTAAFAAEPKDGQEKPSELNADEIEYDMNTGLLKATGNVLLKHENGRATGKVATYNVNTQEALLVGDVIVIRDDVKITCNSLHNDGQGHMQADGNVYGEQTVQSSEQYPNGDKRTFKGEHVDYYPDANKHVVIPTGGIVESSDGTFVADTMEGWLDDEHYIGIGNVHAVSPPRQMEAGGDRIDYFGKEDGKAILTGHAWAIQENNTMRGERLTLYLADDKKVKVAPDAPTIPPPVTNNAFSGQKNPPPVTARTPQTEKTSTEDDPTIFDSFDIKESADKGLKTEKIFTR